MSVLQQLKDKAKVLNVRASEYRWSFTEVEIDALIDEAQRSERLKVIEAYNEYLVTEQYCDTDVVHENDINEFLKIYLK